MVSTDGILPATGCSEIPKMIPAAHFSRLSCVLVSGGCTAGSTVDQYISKKAVTERKGRVFTSNDTRKVKVLSLPGTIKEKLKILQGREAPEVKAKLYKNTEVRYNNALFFKYSPIQLFTEKNN